jgi:hypothetical protein
LIKIGPARAASSSLAIDYSDQAGSLVTKSSKTFVSTKVTSRLATRHRRDLVGGEPPAGMAAQSREAARLGILLDLDRNDAPIRSPFEIHDAPRPDPEKVAQWFGKRNLPSAYHRARRISLV